MVDYDRIRNIVESKKSIFKPASPLQEALGRVAIVADSAHGFGASEGGIMSGMKADFTSFSFHAVKNLTTAEGGALTWRSIPGVDDEDIYKQIMLFRFMDSLRMHLQRLSLEHGNMISRELITNVT